MARNNNVLRVNQHKIYYMALGSKKTKREICKMEKRIGSQIIGETVHWTDTKPRRN